MIVIKRWEETELQKLGGWRLVYGRRKTGKTFLVKNTCLYDEYFFVKSDGSVYRERAGKNLTYTAFEAVLEEMLKEKKHVVVDEFHRLGRGFQDTLHRMDQRGKLTLITSTFHLGRQLLVKRSPLLGKVGEFLVDLIRLDDVLRALAKKVEDRKQWVEWAILLREPLTVPLFEPSEGNISKVMSATRYTVPALVGEVFMEEERRLSRVYEGILRAIAVGKHSSGEISSYLYSNRLIEKDDPSRIQPYLKVLIELGLVKRVLVVNRNKYKYLLRSPLMEAYFYADEHYNFGEEGTLPKDFVGHIWPRLVEKEIRELIAKKLGLREGVVEGKDYDVDGYLLRFKRGAVALEVKWKKRLSKKDVNRAVENLMRVEAEKRILFVPFKEVVGRLEGVEVWDGRDLLKS